jgi:hypothetical protein
MKEKILALIDFANSLENAHLTDGEVLDHILNELEKITS